MKQVVNSTDRAKDITMPTIMTTIFRALAFILMATEVYALEVFFNVQITGANAPKIRVQTNLPDTTKVRISLANQSVDFSEQIKTEVAAGVFEGGPFLDNGEPIRPGRYTVSISADLAQFQSESVQSIIGIHGEELQGPLVHKGMLGRKVSYMTQLDIY